MHEPVEVEVEIVVDDEEVVLEVDDVLVDELVVLTHSLALPSVGS